MNHNPELPNQTKTKKLGRNPKVKYLEMDNQIKVGWIETYFEKFNIFIKTGKSNQIKSKLNYTHGISRKRVTSGGAHLRHLAPRLHSFEETWQRWRAVGDTVPI